MRDDVTASADSSPADEGRETQEVTTLDNSGPLLETKLHVPKVRRSLVARPRLIERMSHGAESKLTLISAPAGFGKTTILTEWLAATAGAERSAAWLSLDQGDNRAAAFWTYLITALQTVTPAFGAGVLSLLQEPQPPPIEIVLATVLNELAAVPNDIVLVLDDYHAIDAPDIQGGMAFLLEHLPARIHLVVTTRADPALPLARLRARGELVEIRAADLRFTLDEADAYLNGMMGLGLAARDVAALERRTEGWIAAPRAGSPRSSWRGSRCRDGTTSRASSRASPETTGTSSTTSLRRSSTGSRSGSGPSCWTPRSWTV
jgi:LuxR family transcriptional regulator, maltose regulon positive regulatory protein